MPVQKIKGKLVAQLTSNIVKIKDPKTGKIIFARIVEDKKLKEKS